MGTQDTASGGGGGHSVGVEIGESVSFVGGRCSSRPDGKVDATW